MPLLQCVVVTPEKTIRDTPAEFVALPLVDGEIGIAPSHSPLIGRLGCGEMRITEDDRVACYYVEGGFVEVLGNTVSVLTNRVIPSKELDEAVARGTAPHGPAEAGQHCRTDGHPRPGRESGPGSSPSGQEDGEVGGG